MSELLGSRLGPSSGNEPGVVDRIRPPLVEQWQALSIHKKVTSWRGSLRFALLALFREGLLSYNGPRENREEHERWKYEAGADIWKKSRSFTHP